MATFGWLMTQARWTASTFIAVIAAATPNAAFEKAVAQDVPSLSQAGLRRIGDYMRHEIATRKIPGAIVLIQQHGRPVYFEKFGARDVAARLPMTDDTVFRLYSMSKPITSVAAMMLVDDGKLSLDDPVAKYIPAFADVKVGVEARDKSKKATLSREPLKRPITILDLLRHTSGITYGFYGERAIRTFYEKTDLYAGDLDNTEFVARLAQLPLAEQPGRVWDYGHSTDVLGRVIEVVSGQSLFQFEKERLLDPTGHDAHGVLRRGRVQARAGRPILAERRLEALYRNQGADGAHTL
jgi:CubicO group peptidase (beta-lactamase class C family)